MPNALARGPPRPFQSTGCDEPIGSGSANDGLRINLQVVDRSRITDPDVWLNEPLRELPGVKYPRKLDQHVLDIRPKGKRARRELEGWQPKLALPLEAQGSDRLGADGVRSPTGPQAGVLAAKQTATATKTSKHGQELFVAKGAGR